MEHLNRISTHDFLLLVLVLCRFSGLLMTAPVYGTRDVPVRVRVLLALALALIVAPTQHHVPLATPATPAGLAWLLGSELFVGLLLGLGVSILLAGVQIAGQLIAQASGLSLADAFNPSLGASVPILAELLHFCTLALFVVLGGHRQVMAALLDSFAALPPGTAGFPREALELGVALVNQSLVLGVRAAGPTLAAQLLATLLLGLVSRTLPQLNILALGFGINSLVTFGTLALSLGGLAWIFQEQLDPYLASLAEVLAAAR